MTEKVKRHMATCDCMREAAWGDYVRYSDYDALRAEAEALRAENERLIEYSRQQQEHQEQTEGRLDVVTGERNRLNNQCVEARAELEAARGLLREARSAVKYESQRGDMMGNAYRATLEKIDAFLTATQAPEVRKQEQGERQEVSEYEHQQAAAMLEKLGPCCKHPQCGCKVHHGFDCIPF